MSGDRKREGGLPPRFEELARRVRTAWGLHRVNPERHPLHEIGRFQAIRRLGEGGFGVVYKARDPVLGREVALKLFPAAGPEADAAVEREARVLARFSHPNIVRVFELGRYGPDYFYAMELVEGITGHELIDAWERWQEVVEIYEAAGAGLAAAHDEGIVHGDFKPANVLLGDDGRVCVADFGLASQRPGTPPYMAPEILRGQPGDARSDQFSFCVALWETLHGQRPFVGETLAELLAAIERGEPEAVAPAAAIPPALPAILKVGLALDPARRWPDMHALLGELRTLREPPPSVGKSPRGVFFFAMLVAFGAALGGASVAFSPWGNGGSVRESTPADSLESSQDPLPPDPVVGHILALIEAGEFDEADALWRAEVARRETMQIDTRPASLRIARAYRQQAEALEQDNASLSKTAALRATMWKKAGAADL